LEKLAGLYHHKVVQVKGDGNCLFRAVSKSLKLNYNRKYKHRKLRSMVAEYLSENPDFLQPYLSYVTSSGETTPEEYQQNVKKYIQNIAQRGTWGDLICLKVLSEILRVKFNLLILNLQRFQLVSNEDSFSTIVPLGFIDDYHYTALVPIVPKPSVVPEPSIQPKPSVVPEPSIQPKPSVVPEPSIQPKPSVVPSVTPSIAPDIPHPIFGPVKPLSSINELLEIMDKVKPYVYDDISQLQKAERQIMVSLGM
jgi:hypothetical protein